MAPYRSGPVPAKRESPLKRVALAVAVAVPLVSVTAVCVCRPLWWWWLLLAYFCGAGVMLTVATETIWDARPRTEQAIRRIILITAWWPIGVAYGIGMLALLGSRALWGWIKYGGGR
jgi:hypothetical protein